MNKLNIGKRIATYRDKLKMSTQDLANRVGRSQATISRIENGKQGVTPELLTQIARVLRVHPFALLSDHPLRNSVLLPIPGANEGEYVSSLFANAIHSGRIRSGLKGAEAAETLEVGPSELRMVEMGMSMPHPSLLEKIATLYGLDLEELQALREFDAKAPDMSRRLAVIQHLFSKVARLCQFVKPGEEMKTIDEVMAVVRQADSEYPMPRDEFTQEMGMKNGNDTSISQIANALRDKTVLNHVKGIIKEYETQGEQANANYGALQPVAVPLPERNQ